YNRDVNGVYYINANMKEPIGSFAGADNRLRFASGTAGRINAHVDNAIVLKNQNEGRSWTASGSLERSLRGGLWLKTAYSYGEAKNTVDPGSIAFGSWNNNQHSNDPNNPGLGFASASPGHRVFITGSYSREYFNFGATTVSVFWEARNGGNTSYTFGGDANGDGGTSNDLLYVHRDTSEMNFQTFTSGGRTYTAAEQAAAWDAYIQQDDYLKDHRGEYVERGAVFLPFVKRMDLSVSQDFFLNLKGRRHQFQFRADVLNFGNLLNSEWGVGQRLINTQPLTNPGVDAQGRLTYRLRVVNNELMTTSLQQTAGLTDVYRVMFSLRYTF
ncbi:MAG: TonB-dependent receptor, partial [Acidobacteria bacterium]|nr:TonB-dependent receptor [Acidobacteriota bacterium]